MGKPQNSKLICSACKNFAAQQGRLCVRCHEDGELKKENVTSCPELLGVDDFDRFMRKLAIHAHARRAADAEAITLDQMELGLRDAVLQALPLYYISIYEYSPERQRQTGVGASFTLKTRIPQSVLYRTVEKLELWTPKDPPTGA